MTIELDRETTAMTALNDVVLQGHSAYERTRLLQDLINRAHEQGIPITEELTQKFREYLKTLDLLERKREGMGGFVGGLLDLKEQLPTLEEKFYDLGDAVRVGFVDSLAEALVYGKDFGQSMKQIFHELAVDMMKFAMQQALIGTMKWALPGFAKGAAFDRGRVVRFAAGDIVTRPTLVPLAGGRTGLMGEAGPEAVLPLERSPSSGKLGVLASGISSADLDRLGDRIITALAEQKGLRVVNVGPESAEDYLNSSEGERVIVNIMRRNKRILE
jgi:hypothetical protein